MPLAGSGEDVFVDADPDGAAAFGARALGAQGAGPASRAEGGDAAAVGASAPYTVTVTVVGAQLFVLRRVAGWKRTDALHLAPDALRGRYNGASTLAWT